MKKYNIVQIGSFDVENYGDLLFTDILQKELSARIEIDNIYLFSPNGGKMPFSNKDVYKIKDLADFLKEKSIDAIVIGGGDVIRLDKNVTSKYDVSFESSYSFWQIPIFLASKYNIKVIFNAPGVPFPFNISQLRFTNLLLDTVDYISVRDEQSKENLGDEIKNKCLVVPDTVNIIPEIYGKDELINNIKKLEQKKIIPKLDEYIIFQTKIINDNQDVYEQEIKKLLEYITTVLHKNILLLPIGYVHNDIEFCTRFIDKKNKNIHIIKEKLSPYDMLSVIACSSGFIGTSLHGLLTANAYNVKIMAINTEKLVKVTGFLKLIEKENVEVTNIYNCLDTYKLQFNNQDFHLNDKLRLEVEKHFDNIAKLISSKNEKSSNLSLEYNYLNHVYDLIDDYENMKDLNEQLKSQIIFFKSELDKVLNSKSFKMINRFRNVVLTRPRKK